MPETVKCNERKGNIIEVLHVSKQFKDENVIDNITVLFEENMIHGIIGRNGSGKTILLKMIAGLIRPTSGEIFVRGEQIGKDVDFPRNSGIIIETPGFLQNQNGYKNLRLLADIRKKISNDKIKQSMCKVGLDPCLRKHVSKYSLGMNQRLGIAQAIMENPTLLILDEPMNGLDGDGVGNIRALLSDLRDMKKTILLASHNQEDIYSICDTVSLLEAGKLKYKKNRNQ